MNKMHHVSVTDNIKSISHKIIYKTLTDKRNESISMP